MGQKRCPKWNPVKWKHGPKPAVVWWFDIDPYPADNQLRLRAAAQCQTQSETACKIPLQDSTTKDLTETGRCLMACVQSSSIVQSDGSIEARFTKLSSVLVTCGKTGFMVLPVVSTCAARSTSKRSDLRIWIWERSTSQKIRQCSPRATLRPYFAKATHIRLVQAEAYQFSSVCLSGCVVYVFVCQVCVCLFLVTLAVAVVLALVLCLVLFVPCFAVAFWRWSEGRA